MSDAADPVVQPAFVIGTGRSGLSPLMDLVAYHPAFAWPSQYLDRFPQRPGVSRLSRLVEWPILRGPLKFRLAPYAPTHDEAWRFWTRQYHGFAEPFRDLEADDVTPVAARRLRTAVAQILRQHGKKRFIAEYSGWSRVGFMREVFPDARFIHIVRDPRAIANSLLNVAYWRGYQGTHQWRWGEPEADLREALERSGHSFVALAAVQWKLLIRNLRGKLEALPQSDRCEIRYEDMVADPLATALRCARFLDVDPDEPRFRKHLGTTRIVDANAQSFRIPSWRDSLTPKQVALLEELLADELIHYGYAS